MRTSFLHQHRPFLVSASDNRCLLAMPGDDANSLIELRGDVLRRAGFEKRHAVLATSCKDAFPRLPDLRRIRVVRDREIAKRQAEIAGPHFGKADARHGNDLLHLAIPSGLSSLMPSNSS